MGQRTSSETVSSIVVAFWRERVWAQAELAREVGVAPRTLRRHLEELSVAGWPFDREDDPPQVYWSVPKGWFPGGVLLDPAAVAALVHLIVRVPTSPERDRLLKTITKHAPKIVAEALDRVVPPRSSEAEEQHLPLVLDAVAQRVPIRVRYFTASRGQLTNRTLSVQRVLIGPPTRFLAWCHTQKALRWFRLDYAANVGPDTNAAFHDADEDEVESIMHESVDGFHGRERARIAFFVRDPDARWVAQNLPEGLSGSSVDGGFLVETETAGLLPVARFVVGLGAAAECRSQELVALVRELAQGALGGAKQE